MAGFVTSLKLENLSADLATFVDGRALDNNAHAIMRYEGGVGEPLWSRKVTLRNSTGVRLRVVGETGFDQQFQEPPNELIYVPISGRGQLIKRDVADVLEDARLQSWKLSGDLKGYLEAFTNLYGSCGGHPGKTGRPWPGGGKTYPSLTMA